MDSKEKEQIKQEIRQELKKEYKMKILIVIGILAIIVVASIVTMKLLDNKQTKRMNNDMKTQESNIISLEELEKCKTYINITTDNWKDYIVTKDLTTEKKDAFGEIKGIQKITTLKLKDNIIGYVILKLKIKNNDLTYTKDEETVIITGGEEDTIKFFVKGNSYVDETKNVTVDEKTYTLDDVECIQIKGILYTIELPERLIKNNDYSTFTIRDNNTLISKDNYIYDLSCLEKEKDNISDL